MSDLLKMTEATALAFHAVVQIALRNRTTTASELAGSLSASSAHLAKVLQRLVHADVLRATRGPGGGYVLAKAPERITLEGIYLTFEGLPRVDGCLFESPVCQGKACIMGRTMEKARQELWEYLKKTSIKELAERETQGETDEHVLLPV
ncbi:Rrf2 family transcriptional regulator [Candidatus Bipolaricaulota bacterium]|nr:Rrf2 family transcriptional regulator [Candidatus Bipolaricaulota bacterium]